MAFKQFSLASFTCYLTYETSEINVAWVIGGNKKSSEPLAHVIHITICCEMLKFPVVIVFQVRYLFVRA